MSPIRSNLRRVRRSTFWEAAAASTRGAFQCRSPGARVVTTPSHDVHIMCTPRESAGADTPRVSVVEPPRSDTPAVPSLASVANTGTPSAAPTSKNVVFDIDNLAISYGSALAVSGITLDIHEQSITALIVPSGCGKSTFLRCMNRKNDLV